MKLITKPYVKRKKRKNLVQGVFVKKILKLALKNVIFEVLGMVRGGSQLLMTDLFF